MGTNLVLKPSSEKAKLVKQIALAVVVFVVFILFWLFLSRAFVAKENISLFIDFPTLIFYLVFFSFLSILVIVAGILVDKFWFLLASYFLSCVFFFVFFPLKILYFLGILLLFIILIWGYFRMRGEKKDRIKFGVEKIARYALPSFITAGIILSSLVYYYAVSSIIHRQGFQIPKEIFDKAIQPVKKILPSFVPGVSEKSTVEEVIYLYTIGEMKKTGAEGFESLPPELKVIFERKGINLQNKEAVVRAMQEDPEIKKEAMKFFLQSQQGQQENEIDKMLKDFHISSKEPIFDALYKVLNERLNLMLGPYLKYFPIGFALVFFFSVRFIFWFLIWAIYLFAWLLVKILIALNFARLEKEKREVETLKL